MNNYLKYIEDVIYRGQCTQCCEKFPNDRTRVRSNSALHAWRNRHRIKTGHVIRTAITYVRKY